MKLYKVQDENELGKFPWIDLVVVVTEPERFNESDADQWLSAFGSVTLAVPDTVRMASSEESQLQWFVYKNGDSKTEIFNRAIANSVNDWVLLLEADEEIQFSTLPASSPVNDRWIAAIIKNIEREPVLQKYEIRLVPGGSQSVFAGKNLPDATSYMMMHDISLDSCAIHILKPEDPAKNYDPQDELAMGPPSPRTYLEMGEACFRNRKYILAAAQYRQVLKKKKLLPFDRLAAVNGLAGCFTEQYKWHKSLNLCDQSIHAEPRQWMPYLIKFRIYQLQKKWGEAYDMLSRFYSLINTDSRANFDKSIKKEDALTELGEIALKAGYIHKAFMHFEEYYSHREGMVDRDFLKRLFVLSAELNDYEKSVFYFEKLFSPYMPDKLSRQASEQLHDCAEFFMRRGWYDYVLKTYEELLEEQPNNNDFRRRLVVALSKTNRMERAREYITN